MNKVYLLIGGNMGNRMANLENALNLIGSNLGTIIQVSSLYETAAWGLTDQPSFLNQAVLIHSKLSATELMLAILAIEKSMGRERSIPLGPRNIDIDIIYFNNEIVNNERVTIPHPRIAERRFVLLPLVEIAPHYIHPILSKSNTLLLKDCGDSLAVHKKTP